MSAPAPQGRTSCAAPFSSSSVAAPQDISSTSKPHSLSSTSGLARAQLDTADPAPRAGDAPSRRRGRVLPSNLTVLRDLTRRADPLPEADIGGCPLAWCPLRGAIPVERRA